MGVKERKEEKKRKSMILGDLSTTRPDKDTLQKNGRNTIWENLGRGKLCRTFSNCPHLTCKDTERHDRARQKGLALSSNEPCADFDIAALTGFLSDRSDGRSTLQQH